MADQPERTPRTLHPDTIAIRTQVARGPEREHSTPLFLTSSFVFDDAEQARALFAEEQQGNIYSRYANPNTDEFIRKMALLEGAEDGIAFASGMAAVFGSMAAFLRSGDHVVASRALFGSTHQLFTKLFPRWGITATYVDADASRAAWAAAVQPSTRMVFVETPSNPGLALIDLGMLGALCAERQLLFVVDNCFTTPMLQQPMKWGAHLVVHSATKFIDGQGRVLGGVVVGNRDLIAELRFFIRHTGPAMSPFNAWVLSKSLETLSVRMERHCANALAIAEHFEQHDALDFVRYPFLPSHPDHALARRQMSAGGGIVVLELKGGLERARRFLDALELLSHTPNLGDVRSIVTHPSSTTHSKLTEAERLQVGIVPGMVRISVGLEHREDLIADITQALERSA
ncbi:MAG TPA: aminotransferase class I/II-fold pyridoxal phosphate-dependent enzyme [Gemmatimonadaceae bacterium]|nr:aminotransferase class I/II-fold pyridoxal phosphate-dependent enzyme [Gemmatimonadaceae bacterium]